MVGDGGLGDVLEAADEAVAGFAFDEDEEAAFAGAAGEDAVHLPVAEGLALGDGGRALFDAAAIGEDEGFGDRGTGWTRFAWSIAEGTVGELDGTGFERVVDGALRRETGPAFGAETVEAGGDGEARLEELDKTLGEAVGEGRSAEFAAFVGGALPGLEVCFLCRVFGVEPFVLDLVEERLAGRSLAELSAQGAWLNATLGGELTHRKARVATASDVRVPFSFQ